MNHTYYNTENFNSTGLLVILLAKNTSLGIFFFFYNYLIFFVLTVMSR